MYHNEQCCTTNLSSSTIPASVLSQFFWPPKMLLRVLLVDDPRVVTSGETALEIL